MHSIDTDRSFGDWLRQHRRALDLTIGEPATDRSSLPPATAGGTGTAGRIVAG